MSEGLGLDQLGETIAERYRIEEVLGRGGMAAVYRVHDARSGKKVALKRGFARDPSKLEKRKALLEREYYTLAQLAHPRIVEVYDYGIDGLGPYYTMELLDGSDLERSPRLSWKEACALLRDVASSLAMLHARGLVHRDVSARNVRRTADGGAKLIDFGAMAPMGVVKEIVGTAPFLAPEVLHQQAIDGRADLFALGALGYLLLTGRHAFPARRIGELRDLWRTQPASPRRLMPEIPQALSDLIVALLALERSARPQSASETIARLCAIAGLPVEEHAGVPRAYLTSPTLVGRERTLIEIRKCLLTLARGDGHALWLEGQPGTGRSRLLDACALEGKLLGALVLRADAGDSAHGDWGAARAVCRQLFELLPEHAGVAARLSRGTLGHVIDQLQGEASAEPPSRSLLLRELRDFVLGLCRGRRVVCLVDDIDRIDGSSAALFAAIAHKLERRPLVLVLTAEQTAPGAASASLQLLRSLATPVTVEPLKPAQTEALLRSVFGDVTNIDLCAGRIHGASHGQPRAIMELAQHLCDSGLARYEAGCWFLPARLREGDLPESLAAGLRARFDALSDDARTLCEVLCLADEEPPALEAYPQLMGHGDARRAFNAQSELIAARILLADGDHYRVGQRAVLHVVLQQLTAERRASISARLAELPSSFDRTYAAARRGGYLLAAGLEREAVELLVSIGLDEHPPALGLLEQALAAAQRLDLPARTVHHLRSSAMNKALLTQDVQSFNRHATTLLEQLVRDSGLSAYHELSDVPPQERLQRALALTQQRYLATPEHTRVCSPIDAMRELGRVLGSFSFNACWAFDLTAVESLPSLEPLVPLSPALLLVQRMVEASQHWVRGRFVRAVEIYTSQLERLSQPDRAGLDPGRQERLRVTLEMMLGLHESGLGLPQAEQRAAAMDHHAPLRVSAWRVRQQLQLAFGNAREARECARQAELLHLQGGVEQHASESGKAIEMAAFARIGDLLGLKSALEVVARLSEKLPGWLPVLRFGQATVRRLEGDLEGALALSIEALELAPPARHWAFPPIAALYVDTLRDLGRVTQAAEIGLSYLEVCEREQLAPNQLSLSIAVAQALAQLGEHARALGVIEPAVRWAERRGMSGVGLGALYEGRARVALAAGDADAFNRFANLCGREYLKGDSPVLSARFARLIEDARRDDAAVAASTANLALASHSGTDTDTFTVEGRIRECAGKEERGRCALTILLQSLESFAGFLYGLGPERLEFLSGLPEGAPEEAIGAWLRSRLDREFTLQGNTTASEEDVAGPATPSLPPSYYTDAAGRVFDAVFLVDARRTERRIAAALVLQLNRGPRISPERALLAQIAAELLEAGDVTGVVATVDSETRTE